MVSRYGQADETEKSPATPQGSARAKGVEVTSKMIEAGMLEMREHHLGDDLAYVIECVYRAMFYLMNPLIS